MADAKAVPSKLKNLRSCLQCKLIKTYEQFSDHGCENCLDLSETPVNQYTTPTFHGMIAMMEPQSSWVARWQRQENRIKGIYAVTVVGELTKEAVGPER